MFITPLRSILRVCPSKLHCGPRIVTEAAPWVKTRAITCLAVVRRDLHGHADPENVDKSSRNFKSSDGIDDGYRIIYKAPNRQVIFLGHSFAVTSYAAIVGVACYATINELDFTDNVFMSSYAEFWGFVGLMCLLSFQMTATVRHYPLRIYADKDGGNYVAVFQGMLPWTKSKIHYAASEVRPVKFLGMDYNIFQLGRKKAFLVPESFFKPSDFKGMTGMDEPVDDD